MPKVKVHITYTTKKKTHEPDSIVDVDVDEAKRLIDRGFASAVDAKAREEAEARAREEAEARARDEAEAKARDEAEAKAKAEEEAQTAARAAGGGNPPPGP